MVIYILHGILFNSTLSTLNNNVKKCFGMSEMIQKTNANNATQNGSIYIITGSSNTPLNNST